MKLNISQWVKAGKRVHKSCPRCSVRAGRFVFKAFPKEFGERRTPEGVVPQSHCRKCRVQKKRAA